MRIGWISFAVAFFVLFGVGAASMLGAYATTTESDKIQCFARDRAWVCQMVGARWHDGGVVQYERCECAY